MIEEKEPPLENDPNAPTRAELEMTIDRLESALTAIRDMLPIEMDNYSRRVFAIAAAALEPE